MITRRELLELGAAAAGIVTAANLGGFTRALAQQRLTETEILNFSRFGNVTLLHIADLHAQLLPVYLREPSVNIGFAEARDLPPHVTGRKFLRRYQIPPKTAAAYALTSEDFTALAKSYGRIGGLDRLATAVKAVRAERGQDRVLLLDGGNTFQGSLGSLRSKGQDVVDCFKLLKPDAMTGGWEFTYGEARVRELAGKLGYPFLALNVRDAQRREQVFAGYKLFEKGGVRVAVLGHAYPHVAAVHPRSVIPNWTFGLREDDVRANVEKARREGASLVVLLSRNGFDADHKLAGRVDGIDVILTGGHDALPVPVLVGKTLLIASGSHGKFLSRLDLDVRAEGLREFRYKLIPLFADPIRPDAEMTAAIEAARLPYAAELGRVVGQSRSLLYRRDTFHGTSDDLIGAALMAERDAEIAFSPGLRWGTTVLPGTAITVEDIHNATAITYPQVYRTTLTGQQMKDVLEDAAAALCHADPYERRGDMVRCTGLVFTLNARQSAGSRISGLRHLKTRKAIEAHKTYTVAGWGSAAEAVEGPPVWELVEKHIARVKTVRIRPQTAVKLIGA